jgi:ribonuclease J
MAPNEELVFLPLGGCEEIGMNLNAYGYGPAHDRRWILADIGVTFGSLETPGVDLICADPEYLVGETIDAIFLTHAHEDHRSTLSQASDRCAHLRDTVHQRTR